MSVFDQVQQSYTRQLGILDPLDIPPITIVGCGASGSAIGIILSKLGAKSITIWDGDKIDFHNIPNQYYAGNTIGKYKADALKEELERIAPVNMMPIVDAHNKFFGDEDSISTPYVFLCADGFENRRNIMNRLKTIPEVKWVIDTRMSGEYFEVWTVKMDDQDEFKEYIDSTFEEAREEPCTARSIIYTIMMMAGKAVSTYKKIIKNKPVPKRYMEDVNNDLYPVLSVYRKGETKKEREKELVK